MTGEQAVNGNPSATADAPQAGEARIACPKCGRERGMEEDACARCGLLASHFEAFGRAAAEADAPSLPELEAAWQECTANWATPAAHDRVLSLAVQLESLPALAWRYRQRLEAGPDEIAEKRLQQIAVLTEAAIRSHVESPTSGAAARVVWVLGYLVAVVVLLASAWLCYLALRHHG